MVKSKQTIPDVQEHPPRHGAQAVPALLRHLNARRVLDAIWRVGPASRAELTRHTGISAPTMSKLVANLLRTGLLEKNPKLQYTAGRPSVVYRLASRRAQVLGAVVDVRQCAVFAAGMDGEIDAARVAVFPTPGQYRELIATLARHGRQLLRITGAPCLGAALSVPGLVRNAAEQMVLSPNLHCLDARQPGRDLTRALEIETVLVQEEHGLCLAEQMFGAARGVDNFTMVDISEGLGMGVVSGGRLLTGEDGFAGELGHIVVVPGGEPCGCGNRGCLETVATDAACARLISQRVGRTLTMDDIVTEVRDGRLDAAVEFTHTLEHLAIGLAAVINIFNPALLFVYGRIFDARDGLFDELGGRVHARSLAPSWQRCRLVRARGNKRQGAVAAAIHRIYNDTGPRVA